MTKAELLTILSTKFRTVATPELTKTEGIVNFYSVVAFELLGGDQMQRRNVIFLVEDEGGPAEAAFWSGFEPVSSVPSTFTADVLAFIAAGIVAGTIRAAVATSIDTANEVAVVWVYRDVAAILSEERFLLFRDLANPPTNINFEKVVNVVKVAD